VGQPESNLGLLIWTPDDLQKAHGRLATLSTHAIGDRAIDELLDGYAATVKKLILWGLNGARGRAPSTQ
jgi:predicted amidohydrolase YtcJ